MITRKMHTITLVVIRFINFQNALLKPIEKVVTTSFCKS